MADVPDDAGTTYTLDELVGASGITVRNIRYYQSERLLPRPQRVGRENVYGADHVERLRLIVDLRDRGLTLNAIRDLVATDQPAQSVATWLGLDATLTAPWSQDRARLVDRGELRQLVGDARGLVTELIDADFVVANGGGTWTVPSPSLLSSALELRRGGIAIDLAGAMRDLMRRRLAKAVDETVKLLVDRAGRGFAGALSTEDLATAIATLKPVTREMTSLLLAQEVERALRALLDEGPARLARVTQRTK